MKVNKYHVAFLKETSINGLAMVLTGVWPKKEIETGFNQFLDLKTGFWYKKLREKKSGLAQLDTSFRVSFPPLIQIDLPLHPTLAIRTN